MITSLALLLAAASTNLLVLTPHAVDFHGDVPLVLLESMVGELKQDQRLRVVSSSDVKDLISLAAEQQLEGCDSTSCLTEVADAFGAGLVVFGDVNRVGREVQLSLRLVNVTTGEVVAREMARATDTAALTRSASDLVVRLVETAFPPTPVSERPLVVAGAIVGGIGALAGLGLGGWSTVLAFTLYGDPNSSSAAKTSASTALVPVAVGAGVGVATAVTGTLLLSIGLSE